ncbi:MAG: hypothetical protein K2M16_08800, partial [Muribaculaceae bacterium]|nr:hypothetical protein [Muribaculaceae bacterium]
MKHSFRLTLCLIVLWLCPVYVSAQNDHKEKMQKAELIKSMSDFIYGEGEGATPADADRNALQSLLGKIGTTVNSSLNMQEYETNTNGNLELKSDVTMIMNSYSQATVNNTQTLSWRDKSGRYFQLKYMLRSELDKMFAHRQDRVEDYVRESLRAEQKGRV